MKKIKIGLIGCGAIGSEIAKAVDEDFKERAELVAVADIDDKKAGALSDKLTGRPAVLSIDELVKRSDLVVEAASARISGEVAEKALSAKKDVMLMSTGGIIKNYLSLFNLAKKNNCRVYLPSGAICGLDGVKAAAFAGIEKAQLVTRKSPKALSGAPFIAKNNIDLNAITKETTIFDGTAQEAIDGFPANINVACTLSMAGIGPEKTRVRIIASPEYTKNIHEIVVEGSFGSIVSRTENVPSPNNPKTSYMAVLSAIATLRQILDPVRVGT